VFILKCLEYNNGSQPNWVPIPREAIPRRAFPRQTRCLETLCGRDCWSGSKWSRVRAESS